MVKEEQKNENKQYMLCLAIDTRKAHTFENLPGALPRCAHSPARM